MIYCVGVLDYAAQSSSLSLQKQINGIEVTQEELQKITKTLAKMTSLLELDKISDGSLPGAKALVESYKQSLKKYLGEDFEIDLEKDLNKAKGK